MTFNIRYDTAEDGPYQLRPYRYEYVDEYLKNFAADAIHFVFIRFFFLTFLHSFYVSHVLFQS